MRNSNGTPVFRKVMIKLPVISLIVTVIVGALVILANLFKPEIRDWLLEDSREERPDMPPENQSTQNAIDQSNIIYHLENEPRTDQRFKSLEANLDSVPSSLSLNQLGSYVQLFQPESYRLRVVMLLQPRIKSNYSYNDLERLKKLFNVYKQSEVEELLPKEKK